MIKKEYFIDHFLHLESSGDPKYFSELSWKMKKIPSDYIVCQHTGESLARGHRNTSQWRHVNVTASQIVSKPTVYIFNSFCKLIRNEILKLCITDPLWVKSTSMEILRKGQIMRTLFHAMSSSWIIVLPESRGKWIEYLWVPTISEGPQCVCFF